MKLVILVVATALLVGCETKGQKMEDLHAEEEARDAKETLSLGAMAYNLGQCEQHLHISLLKHDSPKWTKFAKEHHIDSYPSGMSDADLQDCLRIK